MAIDVQTEELLTLSAAAKRLPSGRAGKSVHTATLHRWASQGGLSGNRLETIKIGGVRYTSAQALKRFIERCSTGDANCQSRPTRQRRREVEKAESELEAAGI